MIDYRFKIHVGTQGATATEIHPIWKDDLAIEYTRESGMWFHRRKLSGSVDLIRADYDLVIDANLAFGTVFYFDIETSADGGTSWQMYWRGRFTRTDCKVNTDDRIITVKPDVVDNYTDILNGYDNEYDLISLTPEIQRILVRKRPVIQIYTVDDDTVDCIYGNQSFEQDADIPSTYDSIEDYLVDRCHFALCSIGGQTGANYEINFTTIAQGYENDFSAPFSGVINLDVNGGVLTNSTDTYYIQYYARNQVIYNTQWFRQFNGLQIYKRGEPDVKWQFEQERRVEVWERNTYQALPEEITFTDMVGGVGDMVAVKHSSGVYSRIVCSVDNVGTTPTHELYSDDIVVNNRNYRRAVGYDCGVFIYQSVRTSATPTKWGRTDNGNYFLPPDDTVEWIPLGRSRWVNTSLWFKPTGVVSNLDREAAYAYMLNDAFPLHSCISVILGAIGADVTFSNTAQYSEFLYGQSGGEYSDPIGHRDCRLLLTPKSNITAGEYQTPAMKGMVTLKDILDMLRDTYRLYWYVDDTKKLRIEHVSWFEKGGGYSSSPTVGIDLTAMRNKRNGKALDYGVNTYEYEKSEMPERYEFGWMDDVTKLFMGEPMQIVSSYVDKGQKEEVTVRNFDSDVDYMLLQPSAISNEGFALLNVEPANAVTAGTYYYQDGQDGKILAVASYVQGKVCVLHLSAYGDNVTLVWWYGDESEVSAHVIYPQVQDVNYIFTVPDGVTGMSFVSEGVTRVDIDWLRVRSDVQGMTETLQVPMYTEVKNNTIFIMQNGLLSFYELQNPYWLYNLPASKVALNGDTAHPIDARSVAKCRKQSVSVPLGDTDQDMIQLVRTGLGDGMIYQASVRLTSRMSKMELRYDTEQ